MATPSRLQLLYESKKSLLTMLRRWFIGTKGTAKLGERAARTSRTSAVRTCFVPISLTTINQLVDPTIYLCYIEMYVTLGIKSFYNQKGLPRSSIGKKT